MLLLVRSAVKRSTQWTFGQSTFLATDIGPQRNENQDRVVAAIISSSVESPPIACIALSDGIGGMVDGGRFASVSIATLLHSLMDNWDNDLSERLRSAVHAANHTVFDRSKANGGATVSAMLIDMDGITVFANVGDSRSYAIENGRSRLRRLTTDDTVSELFGGDGHELFQFIGMGETLAFRVERLIPAGDVFLTSDGAHFIGQAALENAILGAKSNHYAVEDVLNTARQLGGDNATIAAIDIRQITSELSKASPGKSIVWSSDAELIVPAQLVEHNA